ncbi:MAG: hypothetical protein OMM_02440 [Candidatus Magnetoglobus multicellularis str. Araruama]|uniref:Calx-beta domain-containing protein n=1 Tax=Candidatus Magnetoglobus multicellularis str. Araruama TaxID=890399 RepID=A0A1V1P9E1_9BACT|nr:MAG: hypothetical protein OMM_02440 [Candidatus Magnetoglobus multicellularis str. Araruama]
MKSMQYITLFVFCLLFFTSDIHASIPEPDTLIYGKIFNTYQNNSLPVKQGTVAFTIRKKSSTQELTYHSEIECLKCLEYDDGACIHCENFSYVIKIPQKSSINSQDENDQSLDLSADNVQFDYVAATVNGKQAKILPNTHFGNISPEDKEGSFILVGQPRRCHVYNVDLALVMEISDSDNDGLPDIWENFHALNPESPDDASLDNDNDGWTNLEEFNNGTNPSISNQLPTLLENTFQVFEGGISIFRLNIADSDTSDDNINIQFVSAPQGIELVFYGKDAPYEHGHILEYNDSVTLKDLNEGNLLIKCNTSLHESNEIKLLILDDQLNPVVANIQLDVFSPSATNATDAILWADAFDYANKKQEGTALPKRICDRSGNTHHGDFYTGTEDDQDFSSTEIQLDDNALPTGKAVIKQNGYFELPYAAPVFPNGNMTIISAFRASGNDNQILASGPHYEIGVTGKKHPLHPGELRFATESKAIYSNIPVIDDFILATTLITSDKTFIEINGLWTGGPYSLDEQTRLGTDPILGGKVVWEWDFRDMAWIGNFSDIMDGQFAEMIVFDRQLEEHEKWPIYAHFLTKWFGYVVCDFSHASQDIDLRATSGDKSETVRQRKLDADQAWLAYSDAYFNNEGIEDALTLLESYLPDGWQWSVNPPDVDEALAAMDAIKYDYQKTLSTNLEMIMPIC